MAREVSTPEEQGPGKYDSGQAIPLSDHVHKHGYGGADVVGALINGRGHRRHRFPAGARGFRWH